MANWLRANGVKKGNAVGIYLPMIAELAIAVLACARIGAVCYRHASLAAICARPSHNGDCTLCLCPSSHVS